MVEIPAAVRRQALHPFSVLPVTRDGRIVVGRYASVMLHSMPMPQFVEPVPGLASTDVDAAVDEVRDVLRADGKKLAVWLTGPDHPWLADALARRGLRNEDTNALESIETAMAILELPGDPVPGVDVGVVDSYEAFVASVEVDIAAFGLSEENAAAMRAQNEARWDALATAERRRRWNASIEGRVIGTAAGTFGDGGLNLFAGAVLPEARGRGVYRALVQARWRAAVDAGTPALTVQAGRMSRPVLEGLGFAVIAEMPTYVDEL